VRTNVSLKREVYDWLRRAGSYVAERDGGKASASGIIERLVDRAARTGDLETALDPPRK